MRETHSRRAVVSTTAITAVSLLAGCAGGSGDDRTADREYLDEEPAYDTWFEGVEGYNGTVDWTGQDEVTVAVGYNQYSFDPVAIAVSPGTTVIWEWTGMGSGHNVISEDEAEPL